MDTASEPVAPPHTDEEVRAFVAELLLTDPKATEPCGDRVRLIDMAARRLIGLSEPLGRVRGQVYVLSWVESTSHRWISKVGPLPLQASFQINHVQFRQAIPGTNWYVWERGPRWWLRDADGTSETTDV